MNGLTSLYILIAIWGLIALANKSERNILLMRLEAIFLSEDKLHDGNSPYFIRVQLELRRFRNFAYITINRTKSEVSQSLLYFANKHLIDNFGERRTWKIFGYILQLILLIYFVYADAIAITNNMDALGLLVSIPSTLNRYDLAVSFGSLFSVVVGVLVANQMYGSGEITDWKEQVGFWRTIASLISLFLIFSGVIVIIALGLARYARMIGNSTSEATMVYENIGSFITYLLVPVNNMLATLLLATEGIKGFLAVFALLVYFLSTLFSILFYLIALIISVFYFSVIIVFRFIFTLILLFSFFLLTPLDMLASLFVRKP